MTKTEIKVLADEFFEWPSQERKMVTFTSALLFAQYCTDKQEVEWMQRAEDKDDLK